MKGKALPNTWIYMAIALVAMASCADGGEPLGPRVVSISIEPGLIRAQPGEVEALRVVDEQGQDVTQWVTFSVDRAATAAVEDGTGVRTLAHGMTWLRAEYDGLRDSVRVEVPFEAHIMEGLAFALGTPAGPLGLSGLVWQFLDLATDTRHSVMNATIGTPDDRLFEEADYFGADTLVRLVMPGELEPGLRKFESWQVRSAENGVLSIAGLAGAVVWVADPADPRVAELWIPVDSVELQIDEVESPDPNGIPTGRIRGRLAFEAAGLRVSLADGPAVIVGQVGTETQPFYAEFDVSQRLWPIGYADLTMDGGLQPVSVRLRSAQNALHREAAVVQLLTVNEGWLYGTQVRIPDPAVGEFELAPVTRGELIDGGAYDDDAPWAWSQVGTIARLEQGEPLESVAVGREGRVTITHYQEPGEQTFGRIAGSVRVVQDLFTENGAAGTQTVEADFDVALLPRYRYFQPFPPDGPQTAAPVDDPSTAHLGNGTALLTGQTMLNGTRPVAGVVVRLSGPAGTASVTTGEFGQFSFRSLDGGTYSLEFDVPAGYDLAAGQDRRLESLLVDVGGDVQIQLKLSDAEGNGALRVHAYPKSAGPLTGTLRIEARRIGKDAVMSALQLDLAPGVNHVTSLLQPGVYELTMIPPDGYALADGSPAVRNVQIYKGHTVTQTVLLRIE